MGVQLKEDMDEPIVLEQSASLLGMPASVVESPVEIDPYAPTQQMERDGVKVIVR